MFKSPTSFELQPQSTNFLTEQKYIYTVIHRWCVCLQRIPTRKKKKKLSFTKKKQGFLHPGIHPKIKKKVCLSWILPAVMGSPFLRWSPFMETPRRRSSRNQSKDRKEVDKLLHLSTTKTTSLSKSLMWVSGWRKKLLVTGNWIVVGRIDSKFHQT